MHACELKVFSEMDFSLHQINSGLNIILEDYLNYIHCNSLPLSIMIMVALTIPGNRLAGESISSSIAYSVLFSGSTTSLLTVMLTSIVLSSSWNERVVFKEL